MSVSINLFDLGAFESENDTEQDTVAPLTAHATAVDRLYASVSAKSADIGCGLTFESIMHITCPAISQSALWWHAGANR
jgi:hypothetical protein